MRGRIGRVVFLRTSDADGRQHQYVDHNAIDAGNQSGQPGGSVTVDDNHAGPVAVNHASGPVQQQSGSSGSNGAVSRSTPTCTNGTSAKGVPFF